MATQLSYLLDKFDEGSKLNQRLVDDCNCLKTKYENSEIKCQSLLQDHERAVRWITSKKDLVEDYELCIDNLGLNNVLESYCMNPAQWKGLLSSKFIFLSNEIKGY